MLKQLRKLLGMERPLDGLEQILEDVKSGVLSTNSAAEQIRKLASRPHIPNWILRGLRYLGIVFFAVGTMMTLYSLSFSVGTRETEGTVTEMSGSGLLPAIVEYHVDGERFELESSAFSSSADLLIDEKVTILYRPGDPQNAQINTFKERWLFPTMFFWNGIIAVFLSFTLPKILQTLTGTR